MAIYSNYRILKDFDYKELGCERIRYALVDRTTGILWWKKTVTLKIFREIATILYQDLDTGEYLPSVIRQLESAYLARRELSKEAIEK